MVRAAAGRSVNVCPMPGRLLSALDFKHVLSSPPCGRSTHFAAHYAQGRPAVSTPRPARAVVPELSTDNAPMSAVAVDDLGFGGAAAWWLGFVVPKRHARRSVTRNLLRRQMREAFGAQRTSLLPGLWVLRLRTAFDLRQYPSAASDALRRAARIELDAMFERLRAKAPSAASSGASPR